MGKLILGFAADGSKALTLVHCCATWPRSVFPHRGRTDKIPKELIALMAEVTP